jgi:hypothetical protein
VAPSSSVCIYVYQNTDTRSLPTSDVTTSVFAFYWHFTNRNIPNNMSCLLNHFCLVLEWRTGLIQRFAHRPTGTGYAPTVVRWHSIYFRECPLSQNKVCIYFVVSKLAQLNWRITNNLSLATHTNCMSNGAGPNLSQNKITGVSRITPIRCFTWYLSRIHHCMYGKVYLGPFAKGFTGQLGTFNFPTDEGWTLYLGHGRLKTFENLK